MDAGEKAVDKITEKLAKEIEKEYRKAGKEVKAKMKTHLDKFKEKDKKKLADLKGGKITQKQYDDWRIGQIMTGKRWQGLVDELAQGYTEANKTAMRMTADSMKEAYATNHNYGTYQVENAAKLSTNYTIYDKSTVERLMKDKPALLPEPKVDIPKDLRWNRQKINGAITQGILQGEPIGDIANRLDNITGMGQRAATRNARTMVTSAQNAGRVDSYKRAEEMGIEMEQVWLATEDERTRQSHLDMNGEATEVGGTFSNGLKFPADPDGDPSEVYNCRCTLVAKVKGVEGIDEAVAFDNYEKWEDDHKQSKPFDKEAWWEELNKNEQIDFKEWYEDWKKGITQAEFSGVRQYTSNAYREMNQRLRNHRPHGSYKTAIQNADEGLKKARTPKEILTQRKSGPAALDAIDKDLNKNVGALIRNREKYIGGIMSDEAFFSTTVKTKPLAGGELRYVIRIPEGANATYVAPLSLFPSEEEMLINKGARFIINEIEDISDAYPSVRIYMTLIV